MVSLALLWVLQFGVFAPAYWFSGPLLSGCAWLLQDQRESDASMASVGKEFALEGSDYQRGKFCDTFSIISILQTGMILWVRSILRLIRLLQRLLRLRTQVRSCFSNWLVSSSFLCGDRWWFALQNWVLGSKVNRSLIFMLCHITSWLIPTVYCFLLRFNSFMSGMYVTKVQVSCLFLVCSCWKLVLLPGKSIERIYQYGC